ncbi:MAG TPA: serine/threonine-protein kinase, partial [Candidatus Nanopelagicales bacterium]|nr:serine/threonine-protein kinase [Candidatus Nanopelagicales bacterium]
MQLHPGVIIGGKYQLERPLSRGGMGSVWIARHVHLRSPIAIKFMDPTFASAPAFVARFEREARIAANLQSPHVVHVQDYGIDQGAPYLVMELLQGEELGARLQRVGRMSLPEALHLLGQVGKALRRAHEAGLVHRDLKPGNIFLARVEDDEIAKVLDFGIVKETGSQIAGEVTRTGEVLGSPHYMSPEQIRGDRDVDHRSDVWSLGVIVFRMLTGALPFPGDQLGAVMAKVLVDPIPEARRIAPDLPAGIDGFFWRALARDREQRFQSVREMIEDLHRVAGGVAGIAGAPGRMAAPSWTTEAGAGAATGLPMEPRGDVMPAVIGATAGGAPTTLTNAGVGKTGRTPGGKGAKAAVGVAIGMVVLAGGIGVVFSLLRGGGESVSEAPSEATSSDATPTPALESAEPSVAPAGADLTASPAESASAEPAEEAPAATAVPTTAPTVTP